MSGVRLESVRRRSGGRIHLTPRVPHSGEVTTLCGQTLGAGSFAAVTDAADCANCIRRSRDQARISGAFFAQEEGSELLRLSLEQARSRKPDLRIVPHPTASAREKDKAVVWPGARPWRCRWSRKGSPRRATAGPAGRGAGPPTRCR